jgi:hypothetical protein
MEQGDTALPLIEAKSAARPMGGVPPKRVIQSRSMVGAAGLVSRHCQDNKKPAKPVSLRVLRVQGEAWNLNFWW